MTEFYMNCSEKQIDDIVNGKIKIYADINIEIRGQVFECPNSNHFIYKGAEKFSGLSNFKFYRYIGTHQGVEMYHFYNIITQ